MCSICDDDMQSMDLFCFLIKETSYLLYPNNTRSVLGFLAWSLVVEETDDAWLEDELRINFTNQSKKNNKSWNPPENK